MSSDVISKTNVAVKYSLFFKGGQQVVALVMGILLARILSPTEFGIIAIANMIIYYANSFTNFGLNNALIQKTDVEEIHINTVFTLDLIISSVLGLLTFLTADYVGEFFHNSEVGAVLKWMSLYYIITTFYHIPIVILRREIDFKFLSILEFCEALATSVCAILLALNGYSYWSIVISSLSIQTLSAVILIIKTRWLPKIIIGRNMGDIYSFGFWNFIRMQMFLLVSKVDYFVIGRYLSVYSLGLYEKSFELSTRAMSGLSTPLNGVFFSSFSRLKDDSIQVKRVFLEASTFIALICFPVLFGLIGVAHHFVMSCLGDQWKGAIIPLQILATASLFQVLLGLVASVNVATGKYKVHTLLNFITAVVFVVLCFLLVEKGITAISYAYLFYCILSFLFSFSLFCFNTNVKFYELLSAVWCPLVGSICMICIVLSLEDFVFVDYTSIKQLFSLVGTGASVYLFWIYYFYRKGIVSLSIKKL